MPDDSNAGGSGQSNDQNNPGGANQQQQQNAQNSGGGQQQAGGFISALDQDNRAYAEKKGWKDDPNAILKSYRELEGLHSRVKSAINPQGQSDGAAPTVPTSPAGYDLKLPEGLPSNFKVDNNLVETFKVWAHKGGLNSQQAQAVVDQYIAHTAGTFQQTTTQQAQSFVEKAGKAHDDLVKDWGQPDTPGFKRAVEMSRRAMSQLDPGLKDALKAFGVIQVDAKGQEVVLSSTILKALSKVGSRLFAEDDLFGNTATTDNPFDPKKPNAAKAGEVIKKNPELARTLIQAAGAEAVKDWGWWLNRK